MGYKRAVVVLVMLFTIGSALQFFNKKKPPVEGVWRFLSSIPRGETQWNLNSTLTLSLPEGWWDTL
jgi:hypothetical protein